MRYPWFLLVILVCVVSQTQANLLQYVNEIPKCGVTCILKAVPQSECGSITNETCVCTSASLHASVTECVLSACTVPEALKLQKVQSDACGIEPRDRTPLMTGLIGIEAFTLLCLIVRLYARWSIFKKFETDDYVMMATLYFWIAFTVLGEYTRITAFGRDIWEVDPQKVTTALMLFYVDEGLYLLLLALTKISVLGFYLRVFPSRGFRNIVFITMGLIIATSFAFIVAQIFQCWPIESIWLAWQGDYGPKQCVDIQAMAFASAGLNIALDLIVMALPFPYLFQLQTNPRKKAGILVMFSLGILVVVISCLRLPHLHLFTTTSNPTWDFTDALIWTAMEVHVSIIIACLPAIRQFLSRYLPKVFGGSSADSAGERSKTAKGSRYGQSSRTDGSSTRKRPWQSDSNSRSIVPGADNESQIELGTTIKGHSEAQVHAVTAYPFNDGSSLSDDGGRQIHVTRTVKVTDDPWRQSKQQWR
ncbi:uncharacterized protein B0I36DRAFT_388026 [Microdochium trichocladiopsis]|uniref:CFEM domain-containing protein n=1 Tax=Microdochium trichocladiopsis TaxID=1682393 RepID=A0A9P8XW59_9PEZI|nr:uncharacterized protein B0I36DRAFT_388026 [Microdochium trichocladiopsis]KAH7021288.1 hypothetical protein B0I36DRAFT_388026 [Microdochium trichocladiopsis]